VGHSGGFFRNLGSTDEYKRTKTTKWASTFNRIEEFQGQGLEYDGLVEQVCSMMDEYINMKDEL
jgi:hypothetical protein